MHYRKMNSAPKPLNIGKALFTRYVLKVLAEKATIEFIVRDFTGKVCSENAERLQDIAEKVIAKPSKSNNGIYGN